MEKDGYRLLPEDFQSIYFQAKTDEGKRRVICDFVAGMTDRYAVEFYGRLFSQNPQTIFKPLRYPNGVHDERGRAQAGACTASKYPR